jgi:hypothetical protein
MYQLVANDDAPDIKVTITREDTGAAVNISGGTVRLKFRAKGGSSLLFTLSDTNPDNLANGIAVFQFGNTDLDIDEGYYEAEVEITYNDGKVETLYEVLDFYVRGDF